ncbi:MULTISPECIES: hypothetical protein [Pseudomonas]|uniref:hypothetical protein n=1 Tax=Pseudomonas TaxID=286 RepID=UPI000CFEF646|nr:MULTISPECIES: hypothetical protein [Pseudomonas]MCD2427871.1 hypothetical protein [Pseudomonas aeruginosa]HCF1748356.1 hypothetical protein [Pseudomonas aeruginosa]
MNNVVHLPVQPPTISKLEAMSSDTLAFRSWMDVATAFETFSYLGASRSELDEAYHQLGEASLALSVLAARLKGVQREQLPDLVRGGE